MVMKKKGHIRRTKEMWIQLASEFLVLKESNQSLTIKQFCNMRSDVPYNSARVQMKKVLDDIEEGVITPVGSDQFLEEIDQFDQEEEEQEVEEPEPVRNKRDLPMAVDVKEAVKEAEERRIATNKKKSESKKGNSNASKAGMYAKYLAPDIVEKASNGTLENDILFYRSKILMGMDWIEEEAIPLSTELEAKIAKETDNDAKELLYTQLENVHKRIANTEKAIDRFLVRIESVERTIKNIELAAVSVLKERQNIIKTKAQTKTLLMQARKFRAEQQKLKAEEAALKNQSNGSDLDRVIRALQGNRDGLPSLPQTKGNEQ